MEELAVSRARDHLGEAVNQVQYGREMVYLTRHGRRVAPYVLIALGAFILHDAGTLALLF